MALSVPVAVRNKIYGESHSQKMNTTDWMKVEYYEFKFVFSSPSFPLPRLYFSLENKICRGVSLEKHLVISPVFKTTVECKREILP